MKGLSYIPPSILEPMEKVFGHAKWEEKQLWHQLFGGTNFILWIQKYLQDFS